MDQGHGFFVESIIKKKMKRRNGGPIIKFRSFPVTYYEDHDGNFSIKKEDNAFYPRRTFLPVIQIGDRYWTHTGEITESSLYVYPRVHQFSYLTSVASNLTPNMKIEWNPSLLKDTAPCLDFMIAFLTQHYSIAWKFLEDAYDQEVIHRILDLLMPSMTQIIKGVKDHFIVLFMPLYNWRAAMYTGIWVPALGFEFRPPHRHLTYEFVRYLEKGGSRYYDFIQNTKYLHTRGIHAILKGHEDAWIITGIWALRQNIHKDIIRCMIVPMLTISKLDLEQAPWNMPKFITFEK
jgi:hypothetical protein